MQRDAAWPDLHRLEQARERARRDGGRVIDELVRAGEGAEVLAWVAARLGMSVDTSSLEAWRPLFDRLGYSEAASRGMAVAERAGQTCLLVTDPFGVDPINGLQSTGDVLPEILVDSERFAAWLSHFEAAAVASAAPGAGDFADGAAGELRGWTERLSAETLEAAGSPIVRLVNVTLFDAMRSGASDVHLETHAEGLSIKYRQDGVLRAVRNVQPIAVAEQVLSRVKVMAELDIAERRIPQDGRLQVNIQGRNIDVRVSIMPSIHGEDAVLRILDRQHLAVSLSELTLGGLGFEDEVASTVLRLARRPHGMLLVTGPTGAGKTTSLYAVINQTCSPDEKVITIEDPVEYQLPGVLQIPVNERKGLSFARGLRSILRHDPDKILVGEIRDPETAQIAVQAALTGHLVYTTVHANDALDVLARFHQFGIDRYALSSALNGVLAQRLVRRLCGHCAQPDPESAARLAEWGGHSNTRRWMKPVGCSACHGAGYRGRLAIGEVLVLTPELKALLIDGAPHQEVQRLSQAQGARGLRWQALLAASRGQTSWEEVERVTHED